MAQTEQTGFFSKQTVEQFLRYGLTGLLSLGLEYASYWLVTAFTPLWYLGASVLSATLGFVLGFVLNRLWSFRSRGSLGRQTVLLCLVFVFNQAVGTGILYLLTDGLGVYHLLSKIITVGLIALWNFFLYKTVIFR